MTAWTCPLHPDTAPCAIGARDPSTVLLPPMPPSFVPRATHDARVPTHDARRGMGMSLWEVLVCRSGGDGLAVTG